MGLKILLILFCAGVCYAGRTKIIRPCDLDDYKCIGDNLSANSRCKTKVKGYVSPKYVVDKFKFETPIFNASYVDSGLVVRNHDKCRVTEFFFNTVSDRVVMTIDCPFLDLESDRTLIQHRSFSEDTYYDFHIRATYPMLRITINLPSITHMDLCSASIYTEVTDLPNLHIDPKNKPTANYLTKDLTLLYLYERENCHWRGPPLAYIFIDSLICDYGCPTPGYRK
ncbi:fibrohexamerin-like [Anticarsia gemmatalis]|uniref:fibrohexamerin-like n=1 Tax=Anticarsia gemmatalis TaxID=129554 RepID=UPI003F766161